MKLTVENGSFTYRRAAKPVLMKINFEVGSGDLLAILGPNGAGKTTLLRCVMGLLNWSDGRSLIDGRDIRAISTRELWSTLAYVPQARGVTSACTVEELVLLGRGSRISLLAQPGERDIEAAEKVMERLGITRLKDRRCNEISGGELQMALIARALASDPKILVLDEPESNLDFKNQLLIMETLTQLAAEGITCVFNTHYPAHAMQRANRALLLAADGESIFGDTAEVVTEENIRRAFGVRAVISEIETPGSVLRDIVPLSVDEEGGAELAAAESAEGIASISIISRDYEAAERINALLHEVSGYIIGRMGLPCPDEGLYIINVTLNAPTATLRTLTGRLAALPGVRVKTTYADD